MSNLHILYLLSAGIVLLLSCEQQRPSSEIDNELTDVAPAYNSITAKKYGADDYGMKKYVMAFLRRGPNKSLDSAKASEIMTAHLKNINRMAEEGKLVVAGPFFGSGDLRGIYIFDAQSIEEAEALTNTDPAIQAGTLEMELMEWYGSAGLMGLGELHKSLAKKSIID